ALAGPAVNFAIGAGLTALLIGVKAFFPALAAMPWIGGTLRVLVSAITLNFVLGAANLIPLGPLDGQKVAAVIAPHKWMKAPAALTGGLGLFALLGLTFWMLAGNISHGISHHSEGTALGSTHNPFIMALVANGFLLWLLTAVSALKAGARRLRAIAA